MVAHYIYCFFQLPAATAVICCLTTDILARYLFPCVHNRLAVCAGFLGGLAILLWQAVVQVRRLDRTRPRRDLLSMF